MWGRVLALSLVFGGCAFDESGNLSPGTDGSTGGADAGAMPGIDASSAPACLDDDGDGFERSVNGAVCATANDCDDADPRAHPTQGEFFDTARTGGGYDFDCSGAELQEDTRSGKTCAFEFFVCRGTGWTTPVPPCGEVGVWHRCRADFLECKETSVASIRMSCR